MAIGKAKANEDIRLKSRKERGICHSGGDGACQIINMEPGINCSKSLIAHGI